MLTEEFANLPKSELALFLQRDELAIDEVALLNATILWANHECDRQGLIRTMENKRLVLGDLIFSIRFPAMTLEQFANTHRMLGILSAGEANSVFLYLAKPEAEDELPFPVRKRVYVQPFGRLTRFAGKPGITVLQCNRQLKLDSQFM